MCLCCLSVRRNQNHSKYVMPQVIYHNKLMERKQSICERDFRLPQNITSFMWLNATSANNAVIAVG